jgi:hypothetical protein
MPNVLEEKKANIVKRWTIDRNVSYLWLALLMDDNTLHIVNPGKDIKYIYTPVSADPEPRKWVLDDKEAVILDDGNLLLHKPSDEFYHAVYYPIEEIHV